jgi:hypothetical protein
MAILFTTGLALFLSPRPWCIAQFTLPSNNGGDDDGDYVTPNNLIAAAGKASTLGSSHISSKIPFFLVALLCHYV